MKKNTRKGLLGFSAVGLAVAYFLTATLSIAGATYFANSDNENNANTGTADNDVGVVLGRLDVIAPIEFRINGVSTPTTSAQLTVRAWDVDEEQGQTDLVYLNGHLLGKLSGADNVDSTTVFNVPIGFVNSGSNLVKVDIDTSGDPTPWVVRVDWAQLLIDGGAADKGDITGIRISGYSVASNTVTINTQTTVQAITGGNYRMEVSIIDPSSNSSSVLQQDFTATAGQTVTITQNPTYALNGASGTYTIQAQLFHQNGSGFYVQQNIDTLQFNHTTNVGPSDADSDGIIDIMETLTADTDGDGTLDYLDTDSDNDGIPDATERGPTSTPRDTDGDGIADYIDRDSDNDRIPDAIEAGSSPATPVDTDADGTPDYRDRDSDGDRLPDALEGGGVGIDTDNDEIDDAYDVTQVGGLDANHDGVADSVSAPNADGDAAADFRDTDSDSDGLGDRVESQALGIDTDSDGIDNRFDVTSTGGIDANGDGIDDAIVLPDSDADGRADFRDLDSDNDGVPDAREAGAVDADGNGLADSGPPLTSAPDTDSDGTPDYRDLDSDGDGISDLREAGLAALDANSDGRIDSTADPDRDGIPNVRDGLPSAWGTSNDPDGDGLTDAQELAAGTDPTRADTDGDGINDGAEVGGNPATPVDSDGDGIPNVLESGSIDTDGDGLVNSLDPDSDNDGIPDVVERGAGTAPRDSDGDGIPDYLDRDSDNDRIPDAMEAGSTPATPVDTDADGTPDYLDRDSDGDRLPDALEGGGVGIDTDNDEIDDAYDVTQIGGADANHDGVADSVSAPNTDGDAQPDFRDIDSDNDGLGDRVESQALGLDTDADGIDNRFDVNSTGGADANGDGIDDAVVLPDTDADGRADLRDLDSDNDGVFDVIEAGLPDVDGNARADTGQTVLLAAPDTDSDGTPDYRDLDSDADGTFDIVEAGFGSLDANANGRVDNAADPDADGIPAARDRLPAAFGTTPDSDGDGLTDAQEQALGTNPNNPDTDGDGTNDGVEAGANPGVPTDRDGDGIPDLFESGTLDTDGDGLVNALDIDSDNDGIPDAVERGTGNVPRDTDGDGIADYLDRDSDDDRIPDAIEARPTVTAPPDTDGDGTPDYLDLDSDADGLPDAVEGGGTGVDTDNDEIDDAYDVNQTGGADTNADGISDAVFPPNTDGDAQPDYRDIDADGDGLGDSVEASATAQPDSDGDTVPDFRDLDSDNDGVFDVTEAGVTDANADALADAGQTVRTIAPDTDTDGTPDFRDLDSDADGSNDIVEAGLASLDANGNGRIDATTDTDRDGIANVRDRAPLVFGSFLDSDGDGVPDSIDQDIDNDGIPNSVEGTADADGDGTPNLADLDSDGDGIRDVIEAGGIDANGDGRIDNFADSDADGLANSVDTTTGGTALPSPDTDGDGTPDRLDTDSDGDGFSDASEGSGDANGNGVPDFREPAGKLETAVRGVGGIDLWMIVLLASVLVLRLRPRAGAVLRGGSLAMLAVLLLLGAAPQAAQAGKIYVGADIGATHLKPRDRNGGYRVDDTSDTGFRLLVGQEFSPHWAAELFYAHLGAAGIASITPAIGHLGKVRYQDYGAGAEWAPFGAGREATFVPVLKGGLVMTSNKATDPRIGYDKLNSAGFYLGVGAGWHFLPRWTIQAEAISYDRDERMFSLGLRWDATRE